MDILLIEPYCTGSHSAWVHGYGNRSRHRVSTLTLPGRFWKWRMHGGAVTLAKRFLEKRPAPDVILATDMLDLTTFLALTRSRIHRIPVALYFHENQITYPWSDDDRDVKNGRDAHYGFINFASALAADAVFFNSYFHMTSFLEGLPRLLKHFPDYNELDTIERIASKSTVLPLGLDLRRLDGALPQRGKRSARKRPILLWNHRWEYDKNPSTFFKALEALVQKGHDFGVVILGESFRQSPTEFLKAGDALGERVVHMGYVEDIDEYARWLWRSDILPVTSNHDFFGASIIEAIYCGCIPLLPNRLSYPELIPADMHSHFFYNDLDDMVDRLSHLIENHESMSTCRLRQTIARFDWNSVAPLYDEALEKLIQRS